jgi:DnaJ-class molecular chaperone
LFINIIIKIPKKLSETERECFEKIAKENKLNVHNKK